MVKRKCSLLTIRKCHKTTQYLSRIILRRHLLTDGMILLIHRKTYLQFELQNCTGLVSNTYLQFKTHKHTCVYHTHTCTYTDAGEQNTSMCACMCFVMITVEVEGRCLRPAQMPVGYLRPVDVRTLQRIK